jgi:signal transduction histidine kinase
MLPQASLTKGRVSVVDAYRADTRVLTARRMRVVAALLLVVCGLQSGIEWLYHPERAAALLLGYGALVAVLAAQIMVVRLRPALSVAVSRGVFVYVAVGLSIYCGVVHSHTEVLLVSLALIVTGTAVWFPWGARGQLSVSVGALIGYPLALALGATPTLPVAYEALSLVTAVCIAALGAAVLDVHRHSTFQQTAFSAALLGLGRTLDATLSDPQALATHLTEHTRRVLGADWAVLYQKNLDAPGFRVTALSNAPTAVAEEIGSLDFSPADAPELYRLLQQSGTVELAQAGKEGIGPALPLRGWDLSAALLQAIKREQEMIGVLGCYYASRHEPFASAERQLIAAIATQAGVALENARLMEAARTANSVKSEFVATVSHEIRTPLSVILGYTDRLLEEAYAVLNDEQRDMLQRIRLQSTQLNDLIQAMLDLNRLEVRRLPINIESFALGDVVVRLRSNLPAGWGKEGVALRWAVRDEQVVLQSDRMKVEAILRNLIDNALKYTDAGSVTVTVGLHADHHRVQLTVADTGPGIDPAEQSAIFEMFRQGASSSPHRGGVGLGLYIVKRFTEALGGRVSLESRAGAGARFVVLLPVEAPRLITA